MSLRNSSPSSVHGRILLVDDNANGSSARKTVLEEIGHKISVASSGADALEQFSQHKYDLVVTDYKMPKMDGLELIVRLRKQQPDIPIVLVSGFVDTLGLNEAGTGADAVIQKSANEVTHLVRAVNRLLRRKPAKKPAAADGRTLKAKRQAG
ncbi:MAG: response regulator receiver protein [Bryobacterales bacterium]|nr:response regulator receiver protein [Bryobacterales bacterium]